MVDVLALFERLDQALAFGLDVGDRSAERCGPLSALVVCVVVEGSEVGGEEAAAVGTEDVVGEESCEVVEDVVLADAQDRGVALRQPGFLRSARVVAVAFGVAEHAASTRGAEDEAAQSVDVFCGGRLVLACCGAGALASV
ncbi:hypothetical protein NLX83_15825 [Allokutzneria sp. A3M-2-11 16]|uniref:hypothetical protein n=1 Tax=Allokutzneria sp. A3M-2-11 16 TaxID=2962043 RepID=UPI0020B87D62|nr:hypothetical protein [Allokutzneria sp. A3M-2-11 16]MCP3800736.1 hypothetical protein [Allokutzneria sp. A3M-2-11 16]